MAELLERRDIELSHPIHKAPHVERVQRTLENMLSQHMTEKGSLTWVDVLQEVADSYNSRVHRIIKMSPNEAELKENALKVRMAMEDYYHKATKQKFSGPGLKKLQKSDPLLVPGQYVRVAIRRGPENRFRRGYDPHFDARFYRIRDRVITPLPVPLYRLRNFNGTSVDSQFYRRELQPYTSDQFKVVRILKRRRNPRTGRQEKLVLWVGHDESDATWEPAETVVDM